MRLLLVAYLLCLTPWIANAATQEELEAELSALKRRLAEQEARIEELSRRLGESPDTGDRADDGVYSEAGSPVVDDLKPVAATPPWVDSSEQLLGPTLRGYAVVSYRKEEDTPDTFAQEEFSVYFNSPLNPQVNVFAEIEFFHGARVIDVNTGEEKDRSSVKVERALVDWHPKDWWQVRFGKFLTPFGDWNVNHADPLQLTTTKPLATEEVFPETLTGLLFQGTLFPYHWEVDYRFHISNGRGERPDDGDANFRKAMGARVALRPTPDFQLGLSFLDDSDDRVDDSRERDYGLDFYWRPGSFELMGELVVTQMSGDDSRGSEEGLFLQTAYTFGQRLTPVARIEWFRFPDLRSSTRIGVVGLAYRPLAPLLLKVEYQVRRGNAPRFGDNAFLASVATFF